MTLPTSAIDTPRPHGRRLDLVALGEAMVEFNQVKASDGGDGRQWLQGFGGDTSNALIAAARQGARCAYLTRLGDDPFGQLLLDLWRAEGVDTTGVGVDAGAPTGLYFVRHGAAGHSFSYRRAGSAASLMQPGQLAGGAAALIESAAYLHVSGISQAISASARDTVRAAITLARAAGTRVAYDPNLRLSLWPRELAHATLRETLALCDEFLPSIDDVRELSGREAPADIAAWCHDQGAPRVVLKLGERGALVSDQGRQSLIAPLPVQPVDATGAGDCFDGNYLARRARGDDPVAAATWAATAAALATTGYGAVAPLPTRDQVQAALATRLAPPA